MSAEDFSDFDKLSSTDRPPIGSGAVGSSPTDGSGNATANVDWSQVSGADDLHAIEALSGTGYLKRTGTATWVLASTVPWSDISAHPTTLAGYGIVDAQPLDGDLTAIAALTGTNTLYYRSGASTWSPVTIGSGITFSAGTLSSSGGGGGSPGGSNTQVQFNDGGSFGGDAGLAFDKATQVLSFSQAISSVNSTTIPANCVFDRNANYAGFRLRDQGAIRYRADFGIAASTHGLMVNSYDDVGAVYTPMYFATSKLLVDSPAIQFLQYGAGVLKTDSSGNVTAGPGGSGDFVGPASATDNALVRFDGTTGKLGQDSLLIVDDNGHTHFSGAEATGTAFGFAATNTSNTGRTSFSVFNDAGVEGGFSIYGSSNATSPLRNNTLFYGVQKLILLSSGGVATGGSYGMDFITGGYAADFVLRLNALGAAHVGSEIPSADARLFNVAGANAGIQLRRTGSASPLVELVSVVNLGDSEDSAAIAYWDFYVNSNSSSADDFTLRRRTGLANENVWRAAAGKLTILPTTGSSSPSVGALVVQGGLGVAENIRLGGSLIADSGIIRTLPPTSSASTNWQLGDYSGTATSPAGRIRVRLDGVDYYIPAVPV